MKHIVLATVAAVVTAACSQSEPAGAPPTVAVGPTITVRTDTLRDAVPVPGTVRSVRRAAVSTRMMARVTAVEVEVGARVSAGRVLVRLGSDDIAANRARAQAAVEAARAAFHEAERQAVRMDTLYAQDAVAGVQRDQARLQLTQAASQVAMAEASLADVQTAEAYAAVRAPFAGSVVSRSVNVGDLAAPGMTLFEIEGTGAREAILNVPADLAGSLDAGSSVRIVTAGRVEQGTVRAVAGGADPMTRTVEVRVALSADWPTGVAVTGLIPGDTRETITIPAAAVVRRGQLTGVRVVTEAGPVLRWIRLGRSLPSPDSPEDRIEVLSGLSAGERIVK